MLSSVQYLVINFETWFISFFSKGLTDMLYAGKAYDISIVGLDVFKFLTQNSSSMSRDFKSRVKTALRAGQAISIELTLCTQRRLGFERMVSHWTPMKNEFGAVKYVVLTLGLDTSLT